MAKSVKGQKSQHGGKARAAPVSDWLGFIRPHFERYRTLPWGQQREFIEELSKAVGSSPNTLRRFIGGAELLEAFGVTSIPPDLKRLPIAAVEAVGRISKRDPERGRSLLDGLIRGTGTIRDLKDELRGMPKAKTAPSKSAARPLSMREFYFELENIGRLVHETASLRSLSAEPRIMRFLDWPGPKEMLTKAAWPVLVYPLLDQRYVAIFDETVLTWGVSPAMVTREFLRNISVAATLFEAVIAYCNVLHPDAARIVAAMRGDVRDRILLQKAPLRIGEEDLKRHAKA